MGRLLEFYAHGTTAVTKETITNRVGGDLREGLLLPIGIGRLNQSILVADNHAQYNSPLLCAKRRV